MRWEVARDHIPIVQASLPANPWIKYFNGAQRGYVVCEVTPQHWRTDYRVVSTILEPVAPVSTAASFVVEDGLPGALPV